MSREVLPTADNSPQASQRNDAADFNPASNAGYDPNDVLIDPVGGKPAYKQPSDPIRGGK